MSLLSVSYFVRARRWSVTHSNFDNDDGASCYRTGSDEAGKREALAGVNEAGKTNEADCLEVGKTILVELGWTGSAEVMG